MNLTEQADLDAQVLALLIDAEGEPLSGQAICEKLDVPRRTLLASLESLRGGGFVIASGPSLGYRLASMPEGLTERELSPLLATNDLGRKLYFHQTIGSTNDEAHRLADEGAPHGTVVIAEEQTAGRGRRGRSWVAPPGKSLCFSVVLRPDLPPQRAPELTLIAAVAVCEAAQEAGAPHAAIKWPNDVLCGDKKLAGLLLELRTDGDRVGHVVLGVGVNVNVGPADLPAELRESATSLAIERPGEQPRGLFCARLLGQLEDWLGMHEALGFGPVRDRWKELSCTLHRRVRVELGEGPPLEGEAIDLDETGALLVRVGSGAVHRVVAGDIVHLRRAPD